MIRELADVDGHALPATELRRRTMDERIGPTLDDGSWDRILSALEVDGLVHRRRGLVCLGAATIGP